MDQRPFNILSLCSGGAGLDLGLELASPSTSGPRLNPVFVSWLMGWPLIVLDYSNCSATEWCHFKQRMRSCLFGLLQDAL